MLRGSISLVVRAAAPEPQGARLLSEHALHHQRGLVQVTAPAGSRGLHQEGPWAQCSGGPCQPGSGGPYLAVKETWRVTEVGGALTGRASSSPLLGETLKATGSLSGSCWPAGWGGHAGGSTDPRLLVLLLPPTTPGGGTPWGTTSDEVSGRQRSNSQLVRPISTGPQAPSWGSRPSGVGEEGRTHLSARPSSFGSHSGS